MSWLLHFHTVSLHDSAAIPLRFHCPACRERDVNGVAWTRHHVIHFLGIVEVADERTHWVRCPRCDCRLWSSFTPEALTFLDADAIEANGILVDRVSPVKVALLLGAFLLFCLPFGGLLFFLLAWLPNGSTRPWFRIACRVWLLLHLIAMNALVLLALLQESR